MLRNMHPPFGPMGNQNQRGHRAGLRWITVLAGFGLISMPCRAGEESAYVTPPTTLSPNGRLAVKLPVFNSDAGAALDTRRNIVVETQSGKEVAVIEASPGYDRPLNNREVEPPNWSADSSLLLWKVSGRWFPTAVVLLRFKGEKQEWQLNILKTAQDEILVRTRKAAPALYAAAALANAGNGTAYPDGFTIDVKTDMEDGQRVSLPLRVRASLSANPKQIEDFPANLDASMEATVTPMGELVVGSFRVQP